MIEHRTRTSWLLALGALTGAACAGDGGEGNAQGLSNGAARGCEIYAETWCERAIGCVVELGAVSAGDREPSYDVCVDVASSAAQCQRAIELGPTYDQCLVAIDAKPCGDWDVPMEDLGSVSPPEACRGQILVRR